MSDPRDSLDDTTPTDGLYAAWARSESRYGRRHHDADRWQRYTAETQDRD